MLDKIAGFFRREQTAPKVAGQANTTPQQKKAAAGTSAADAERQQQAAQAVAAAEQLLASDASPATAARLVQQTELPADLRCRALARISDPELLRTLALQDKIARVRLAAAERLARTDDLEILRRDSSDKAVQRHVREALKAQREQAQAAREAQQRIDQLLGALEQHARRAFEPLYDAKLDNLASSWQTVATAASAAERERYAELSALCRDTAARHAAEIAAREQAIAAKQQLIAACAELEGLVNRLRGEDLTNSVSAVAALRTTQRTRWEEAATQTPVDEPLARRYRAALPVLDAWLAAAGELPSLAQDVPALAAAVNGSESADHEQLDAWQEQLDTLLSRVEWPSGLLAPAVLQELDAVRRRLGELQRARQADVREQVAHIRRRRHALKRMIDEGQLRVATRTQHWLRKRIEELPPREAESERTAQAPVDEALARLHDWYEFASVPKKTELCEQAEALAAETVDAALAADVTARGEQVRALRDRWNMLCAADPDADPELRARFDSAIDKAWAPCAAWYAALRQTQDDNLAGRAALCDALDAELAAIDARQSDWKALEQREREARGAWKSLEPVRWPEARASQERFTSLIARLRELLDGARRQGAARRQALLETATALSTHEPLEAAIVAAKKLQEDWKGTGYCDPREDRRLWGEFRAALDAVFARRDASRNAERQAREAALAEAQAERAAEETRRRQREQAVQDARRAEIDLALAVAAAESRQLAGETVDAAPLAGRLSSLPAKSPLAAPLRARIDQLQNGEQPAADVLAANTEALALLTLDLEILCDLPTPAALGEARMARQVARLAASLRGARPAEERQQLVYQWLATGPVPARERDACRARIETLLQEPG